MCLIRSLLMKLSLWVQGKERSFDVMSLISTYGKILTQKRSVSGSDLRDLVDGVHSRNLLRRRRTHRWKCAGSHP